MTTHLFHLYLMSYGVFRFCHEFQRDTPGWGETLTGYQVISVGVVLLGAWGIWWKAPAVQSSRD